MDRKKANSNSGFIALVSVLILAALIGFLIVTLFRSGLSELSISSSQEKAQEADFLVRACLEEGVFKLKENIAYQGEEKLILNGKECLKIKVDNLAPSRKIVSSLVAIGDIPQSFQRGEREIRYYLASRNEDWQKYQELKNLEIVGDSLKLAEGKIERITATSSQWADYFSLNNLEIVDDSLRLLAVEGEYATSGNRVSLPLSLDKIKEVKESNISWTSEEPVGTNVKIKTAVNSNPNIEPQPTDYLIATNGGSIPLINQGEDLSGKYLWLRQELETTNTTTTPILNSLTELITGKTSGYWISLPIDISSQGQEKKVFSSQIFWQAESFFENFIIIETRFSENGETWSDWQEVRNSGEIPGLERGTILGPGFLQIKVSFWGGPDLYPVLEGIKIFVELE